MFGSLMSPAFKPTNLMVRVLAYQMEVPGPKTPFTHEVEREESATQAKCLYY